MLCALANNHPVIELDKLHETALIQSALYELFRAGALCIVPQKTFSQNGAVNRVAQHDVGTASAQISLEATTHGLYTHGMAGFDPEKLAMHFEPGLEIVRLDTRFLSRVRDESAG